MKLYLALLLLAASLGGCGRQSNPAPPPPAADRPASGAPAGTPKPAAGPTDLATAAKTQQEGADTGTATDGTEASLERIAALPAAGQLPPGPWVAGKNYDVLSPAQPTDVPAGKIEIIEWFWYACPHCFALDSTIEAWRRNKPAYVDFRRIPVMWGEEHRDHAHLFFTLKVLGKLDELHTKVFDQIHQNGDLLYTPGDEKATLASQLQFARANGISEADFLSAYNSFAVQTNLQQAYDLSRRERIDSVPTFVVDGKFVTDAEMAGSPSKLTQLLDDLAASEKHH